MSTDLPYAAEVTDTAAELTARFGELGPGTETGQTAAIAGRLMLRRVQGKLAFGTIADHTGRIQLFAPSQSTPEFEAFCALSLGDWISVSGEIMTTKRGELSVRVDSWTLLGADDWRFPGSDLGPDAAVPRCPRGPRDHRLARATSHSPRSTRSR